MIFDTRTFPGDGRYLLAAAVFGILVLLQLIRLLLVKLLAYLGNMDVITPL